MVDSLAASIREGQGKIFTEDLEMLELQQRNLSRWPEHRLMKLNIDAGGVHARRVLQRLVAQVVAEATGAADAVIDVAAGGKRGIASICIGGGQGGAMLVEALG